MDKISMKTEVLERVAHYCFEGTLDRYREFIPIEIIPHGSSATLRCCVYREREIVRNRVQWATGSASVYGGGNNYNYTDEMVAVLNSACEGCPLQRYTVTSNCQHCMAQKCMEACRFGAIMMTPRGAMIDSDKCRECGMCAKACPYNAIADARRPCVRSCPVEAISVDKVNHRAVIDYNKCITCGTCTTACPFAAISDVSMMCSVIDDIRDGKEVYACFAPSIEGQFGNVNVGEMIQALKRLGFADAVEVALGADATAVSEAHELMEVAREGGHMTTSCCPAFYNMVEKHFPTLLSKVSHTVSPMAATARWLKDQHPGAKVCFIGPCIAKKSEVIRYRRQKSINADYVLTYEELSAIFKAREIDPEREAASTVQQGSLYGKNFAISGGVSAAVAQVLKEEGFDMPVTCSKCNGAAECKKALMMLKVGKLPETIIEGMACIGGCVNGPAKTIDIRSAEPFRHNLLDEADKRNITDNLTDFAFSVDMKDGRVPDELPDLEP